MRSVSILVLLLLSLAFVVGCSSNSGSGATSTPAVQSSASPSLSPTVAATATAPASPSPAPGAGITDANAGALSQVATGQMPQPYSSLTWRSDGQSVFVTTRSDVYSLARDGRQVVSLLTVNDPQHVLAVSPEGIVAIADGQSTIVLRDLSSGDVLHTLSIGGTVMQATFSPDGSLLAVTLGESITAELWDVDSGTKSKDLTGFQTAAPVYAVRFGPNSRSLLWWARAEAQVMDLVTGQLGTRVSSEFFLIDPQLNPAGDTLVAGAGPDLNYWDLANGQILDTVQLSDPLLALGLSPDGQLIAIADNNGVDFRDTGTDQDLGSLPNAGATGLVAFSPDGDAVATVSRDGAVAIWTP